MSKLEPITPGEILSEEFLIPMGLSQYRLAKEIGVPGQRISEIVAGKRAITADTDLRLCRFFGLSNGYWLRAQAAYDTEVAERTLGPLLEKIKPWSAYAAQQNAPADASTSRASDACVSVHNHGQKGSRI
jgi:antitoxin HigA-1